MTPFEERSDSRSKLATVHRTLVHLRRQALWLLPGTLALLGVQIFAALRGAFGPHTSLREDALVANATFIAGSVLLQIVLIGRGGAPLFADEANAQVRLLGRILALGVVTLLLGVAGDIFVAVDIVSSSWALGCAAASALIILAWRVWW